MRYRALSKLKLVGTHETSPFHLGFFSSFAGEILHNAWVFITDAHCTEQCKFYAK
jgi:hypothetical protein